MNKCTRRFEKLSSRSETFEVWCGVVCEGRGGVVLVAIRCGGWAWRDCCFMEVERSYERERGCPIHDKLASGGGELLRCEA